MRTVLSFSNVVLATRNSGKLREFRSLLAPTEWKILGLADLSIELDHKETGRSFAENARTKALFYSHETEYPVLADDSGLEVFALGGRPGVYSARYGSPGTTDADRIQKLLEELKAADVAREARFICALALAQRGSLLVEVEGECRGLIADEPRGNKGFGYDPIFLFPELGKTYAELDEAEKNRHSHRGHAVRALLEQLATRSL